MYTCSEDMKYGSGVIDLVSNFLNMYSAMRYKTIFSYVYYNITKYSLAVY